MRRPTAKQRQVLHLVAAGCSNKQVATRLRISEGAVKKHLEGLMQRYDATNRAALVRASIEAGHLRVRILRGSWRPPSQTQSDRPY